MVDDTSSDPNQKTFQEDELNLQNKFQDLENKIGATTEAAQKWLKEQSDSAQKLREYKAKRDSIDKSIIPLTIEKAEVESWAGWANKIAEALAKNPEAADFKLIFYLLKKIFLTVSYEKIAPTIQNSVNEWLSSIGDQGPSFLDYIIGHDGPMGIYQTWPQYFRGFDYEPGSEKQSEFYFDPKTWKGVGEALYQEAAWRGLSLDQMYSTLLYLQVQISQLESSLNSEMPQQSLLEDYKKQKEELERKREEQKKLIAKYNEKIEQWRKTLRERSEFTDLSDPQVEAEAQRYALMALEGDEKANSEFQSRINQFNQTRGSRVSPIRNSPDSQLRTSVDANRHGMVSQNNQGMLKLNRATQDFLNRAQALQGQEPSLREAPARGIFRGFKSLYNTWRGGGVQTTTPGIEAVTSSPRGVFGQLGNLFKGKSGNLFGASRSAAVKTGVQAGTTIAGGAAAGGAAAAGATGGAVAAAEGTAAVFGGPVAWAIAAGSFLLNKNNRDAIKHWIETGAKIGIGYIYTLLQGAAKIIQAIATPFGLTGAGASAGAFGTAGFVPGFTAHSALATATSTGAAGGMVGGAGFGSVGGGGASGFGLAVSSSPLMAVGSVAATAVVVTAIIIPAAFAQPPEAIEQYDPPKFTISKEIESVKLNGTAIDIKDNKIANIGGSSLEVVYKITFTSAGEAISLGVPTEVARNYKANRDPVEISPLKLIKGEYPTHLAPNESKSVQVSINIPARASTPLPVDASKIYDDSRIVNSITVTGTIDREEKPTSQTQSATASLVIGNPIDGAPYGFPIAGLITSLDDEIVRDRSGNPAGGCLPDHNHCGEMFASRKVLFGGLDIGIGSDEKMEVKSTVEGYVDVSSFDKIVGGKVVVVSLSGQYRVAFLHLQDESRVAAGSSIKRGDKIGYVYSRSQYSAQPLQASSGPHVHYQITSDGANVSFKNAIPHNPCDPNQDIMSADMNKVVAAKGSILPAWITPTPCTQ